MYRRISVLAVTVIALTLSSIAHAQIERGKTLVGASINYNNRSSSQDSNTSNKITTKSNTFTSSLDGGFFVSDKVALGMSGGISKNTSARTETVNHTEMDFKGNGSGYFFGPFIRVYQPIVNKLYFFLNTQFNYGFGSAIENGRDNRESTTKDEMKYKSLSLNLTPGLAYFLTRRFSLELTGLNLGVTKANETRNYFQNDVLFRTSETSNTAFNLNPFNLNFQSIYLGGKFYF